MTAAAIKTKGGELRGALPKPRIAFFDIDGTLVPLGKNELSDKTRAALLGLQAAGVRIVVATGRPISRVPAFAGVSFDAFLTFNGSYCADREKRCIAKRTISREDAARIIRNAAGLHRPVALAGLSSQCANGTEKDLADYYAISGQRVPVRPDFDGFLSGEDIYQIMMGARKEEYGRTLAGTEHAEITAWWPRAVDIIPKGSGKGQGVGAILRHFGLSRDEAIAFGDGRNDIPMFRAVGTGVAMGNTKQDVKDQASDLCPPAAEDGIWQYLTARHYL